MQCINYKGVCLSNSFILINHFFIRYWCRPRGQMILSFEMRLTEFLHLVLKLILNVKRLN